MGREAEERAASWHPRQKTVPRPKDRMSAIKTDVNPRQFQMARVLMKGRPSEPDSHQTIACYNENEFREYLGKGWVRAAEFLDRAHTARKDRA